MRTLNEISFYIVDKLGQPFNAALQKEVKMVIMTQRAVIIRRDITENRENALYTQPITIDLQKVDKYDPCAVIVNCPVLRSVNPIPTPIRLKENRLFQYAGETGGGKIFTYTEPEDLVYTAYNKWTADIVRYSYANGYLYVYNNTLYKQMDIKAAWEDPTKVNTCATVGTCYNDDKDFPCPADIVQGIIEAILNGEVHFQNLSQEVTNDIPKQAK